VTSDQDRSSKLLRVPLPLSEPGIVHVPSEVAHYITRVHRLGPGDRFIAFDPDRAVEALADIEAASRGMLTVRVGEPRPATVRPSRRVTLVQATCKGDKMDAIVRDATELGATRIIPAISARSVARPDAARAERWRRITIEAARQCGRGDAPVVDAPVRFDDALHLAISGRGALVGVCLDPRADRPLGACLRELSPESELVLVVGPEGGLDEDELAAAERAGFMRARIGPLVLRAETVCAAVLGALSVMDEG